MLRDFGLDSERDGDGRRLGAAAGGVASVDGGAGVGVGIGVVLLDGDVSSIR